MPQTTSVVTESGGTMKGCRGSSRCNPLNKKSRQPASLFLPGVVSRPSANRNAVRYFRNDIQITRKDVQAASNAAALKYLIHTQ
jgi:hypothetical protein